MKTKYQEPSVEVIYTIPSNVLLSFSGEGDNDGFEDDLIQ